ncbi:uncharacterized protein LOC124932861 isoform X2 [Impatiens glandulifera]|uniref:uncharacterized protein LOC124932861 isoform X2 n=1 Tax=Impatiens glandulifera TaxID=253017 RepID=UPI001FB0B20C|nr:uncharacterized protein LOC124932861 isoform X2 [Impatiens glandulifera]
MQIASLIGWYHNQPTSITPTMSSLTATAAGMAVSLTVRDCHPRCFRYDYLLRYRTEDKKTKKNDSTLITAIWRQKKSLRLSPRANSSLDSTNHSSRSDHYQEVMKLARQKFTQEISFESIERDISLAKALLYIAAEDESFMAFNREMDAQFFHNERKDVHIPSEIQEWENLETMPLLGGRRINDCLTELDSIAKEVQAELVSREIGCHFVEVLEAVNLVLFESRGFKRSPVLVDPKYSYLHSVLSSGCGSAIILSIIYIEVCRRLNLTIVGSRVGEEFFIWPQMGNPEELFKVTSGHSLVGVVNGRCVDDPRSKASDLNSSSLSGLEIATNRDIIGIALANLIRLHWKRASRKNHGLMLTSPLRPIHEQKETHNTIDGPKVPLVRPQDLRFKMLILQVGMR